VLPVTVPEVALPAASPACGAPTTPESLLESVAVPGFVTEEPASFDEPEAEHPASRSTAARSAAAAGKRFMGQLYGAAGGHCLDAVWESNHNPVSVRAQPLVSMNRSATAGRVQ